MSADLRLGDCRAVLQEIEPGSVRCCVTSPPYWGLRDYGVAGQLGLEASVSEYVERMVEVFRLVRDALADDGTLWLNLGDSYCAAARGSASPETSTLTNPSRHLEVSGAPIDKRPSFRRDKAAAGGVQHKRSDSLKPKDLVGIPWRVAFALQDDGWYLRSDIVWHKPNPMPESVLDRPTKAHEYVFLLAKSERYFYDARAIAEPVTGGAHPRGSGVNPKARVPAGWDTGGGGIIETRRGATEWRASSKTSGKVETDVVSD